MIIITSTFTADVMHPHLKMLLENFSDQEPLFIYNQIFQQMLMPSSAQNQNKQGMNVILIRLSDLFPVSKPFETQLSDMMQALQSMQKTMHVPLLMLITPSLALTPADQLFYDTIELQFKQQVDALQNIILLTSNDILSHTEPELIFDSFTEKHGHIPYTLDFYNSLSTLIARKYSLLSRKPYKVIILDCDETLWSGVVEEDGIDGIVIDQHDLALQQFILECHQAGFLLCLCSKNSEDSIFSVFKHRTDLVFDLEKHICTSRINWQPKSHNIQSIADELDLDPSSFIFIDDNKLECAEVKSHFPEVLVLELPKQKKDRLSYLKHIWAFDYQHTGAEDSSRTEFYQKNKLRHQLKSTSVSYKQFLKTLNIKTHIQTATNEHYERVIQLNQRTNQFNLCPNAMTSVAFQNSIVSGTPQCLTIHVSDKYGEYGLVGVVAHHIEHTELKIHAFFLSCRILGLGIEYDILKYILTLAKEHQVKTITIPFTITAKNIPAIEFLKKISGLSTLPFETPLTLNVSDIISHAPDVPNEPLQNSTKPIQRTHSASNDFMIDIAQHSIKASNTMHAGKGSPKKSNTFQSIKINLLERFKQHDLVIANMDSSFLDLGIDSLKAVLIASEIFQTYQIEINPFELLHQTVTVNKLIKQLLEKIEHPDTHPISTSNTMVDIPLSNAQKRLWYDEKLSEKTSRNNMFLAYELPSDVHIGCMERAFLTLIERHDVLRFAFYEKEGDPFIKVQSMDSLNFQMQHVVLSDPLMVQTFAETFQHQPFELYHAPLLRVALVQCGRQTRLLISIHHIIHDGWSLNVLSQELSLFYNAYSKNIALQLPPQTSSYVDFIYWEKEHISHDVLLNQKEYWEKSLYKLPKLELIYDKIRKENNDIQLNHRINFKLDEQTTRQLKRLSINQHVTLYDLLISAFGLLLSHYTNQSDVSFLTAVSGRHHAHTANMMGFFVNLLLVRFQIGSDITFQELLKTNKKILNHIFAHQDLPYNEILQFTGETVNSKVHAFSQAGFIFQNYPTPELTIDNEPCQRVYDAHDTSLLYDACRECRFGNLVCFMQELGSHIHGVFEFNTSLFHKNTIEHMIKAFKTLLKHITQQQNIPAINIELLTDSQKNTLFHHWNPKITTYPKDQNLISIFTEQVTKNPNAIAITYQNKAITYGELDKQSNQMAHRLQKMGVTYECPVGIFIKKDIEHIVAMLSIIKAGGYYVPLAKSQPQARIQYIIKDVGLIFLITDTEFSQYLEPSTLAPLTILNVEDASLQSESHEQLMQHTHPEQLAYVLYTSGTTGDLKGVMIEQAGIIRLVKSTNYINISEKDRFAQTSNVLFDAATFEIWGALLNGAHLVLIDKKTLLDATNLGEFLKKEKISILFLTTQLFHSYAFTEPSLFQKLKYLVVGGEAVLSEAVQHVFDQTNPPTCFINGYGPTENTTFSTTFSIKKSADINDPIYIGKPITGTKAYVLGKNLKPKPVGAPGRLYLSGIGLARKYLNQDALNQEKFIEYEQEKLYDTGDIVAWQSDGHLKYMGREDDQIKINGYRIELNEIEAQLKTHPMVEQAIVLVVTNNHHRHLAAYILLKDHQNLAEVNLYHHLKTTLPKYMLPSFYCQVDHLPITNTGKVDKKMLIGLNLKHITYTEYESPTSLLQNKIISIYAEILHIDPQLIGVNSEFFDLGGNSISALSLIRTLNDQFHVKLNFSILYEYANVKLLSEQISQLLSETHFTPAIDHERLYENSLKKIKSGRPGRTPIVFVHPIGGTGFCYLDLIKLLPEEQPCYIIQDPSIDSNQILFDDIVSMASFYNHLLLKKLPINTFMLAGYSFGGMLALEMVSQLEQKNSAECVTGVISFDTWVVSNCADTQTKEALKHSIMQQYHRVATDLIQENFDPQPWMELYYYRLQDLGMAYTPPVIHKKIILFKAQHQSGEFSLMNHDTNYLDLHTTKEVDIHLIPGNHDSILKLPHVKSISEIISHYIMDPINEMA
ncbi:MAG: hypothetical protein CK424_01590 [Legionella sp.]|nr:MAG: hypothetical protein CK424_01590 [Legionella sp.]